MGQFLPLLKRRWVLYLVTIGGLAALSVADSGGLRKHARLQAEVRRVEAASDELRRETQRLRREARALGGEPAALERAAREELGYIRPGEIVIQLDESGAKP